MSDTPVRTLVHTDEGDLPFQHYFVRRRCEPLVIDVSFVGADEAQMSEAAQEAIAAADHRLLPQQPLPQHRPHPQHPGNARL